MLFVQCTKARQWVGVGMWIGGVLGGMNGGVLIRLLFASVPRIHTHTPSAAFFCAYSQCVKCSLASQTLAIRTHRHAAVTS